MDRTGSGSFSVGGCFISDAELPGSITTEQSYRCTLSTGCMWAWESIRHLNLDCCVEARDTSFILTN
jgi:hypothetical protein